jgi:hypothetical protein
MSIVIKLRLRSNEVGIALEVTRTAKNVINSDWNGMSGLDNMTQRLSMAARN